jgi:hypothetical protein
LLYKITDQDISLLVLDPTVRNGYSISPDFKKTHQNTIRTAFVSALLDNLAVILGFLTLQDKHNMRTWSIYTYTCTDIDIYDKYFYFYDDLLFLLILSKTNKKSKNTKTL